MTFGRTTWAAIGLAILMLAGCNKAAPDVPPPAPAEVSDEATGHYCGMLLADHEGPKGQIHLASRTDPLWFSSVRDTIAFLRLPEEAKDVAAVYVNDMGKAQHWDEPEAGTWIDANAAWFVLDSAMRGGMGANEAVPFSTEAAAEAFRAKHGGSIARLGDIPDAYVLGPVDLSSPMPGMDGHEPDPAGKDRAVDGHEVEMHGADGHDAAEAHAHPTHPEH
ncbi:nitrous oxide reductase accessory protein NosL [Lysobacter sp. H21R4]|uniref:nitrous oxide reductase accessory protein NosL n=1 Tax=Lysobacter sp. H21R4 TaxID=2781021 RepID=UPI001887B9F4|nr:nitrous oxide reductase accessory protein NosL [Lysobacter sp. H21R4]QOY63733.1 nitrous oxide reductase accessory protein NosL [Lysobacter sp. H21R4]